MTLAFYWLFAAHGIGEESSFSSSVHPFFDELGISYKETKEGYFIPKEQMTHLQAQRPSVSNSSSEKAKKGFELFDSSTWIKGDKELKVLEMRALKDQIERDLIGFESIKGARVLLDIPPPRRFANEEQEPKASVILTIAPKSTLSPSLLIAMTSHICGAVHGLKPNHVAVSDTSGKVYQKIDEEESHFYQKWERYLEQQRLLEKVKDYLSTFIDSSQYRVYGDLQEGGMFYLDLLVDESLEERLEGLKKGIVRLLGLKEEVFFLTVEKASICSKAPSEIPFKGTNHWGWGNLIFFISVVASVPSLYFFGWMRQRRKNAPTEKIDELAPKINVDKLAKSLEDEDPELIAWTLSYLEPRRAERIIARFPSSFQEEVMSYMAHFELEYEE